MDKFITKPTNEAKKEIHNYTPFEFLYCNIDEGQSNNLIVDNLFIFYLED